MDADKKKKAIAEYLEGIHEINYEILCEIDRVCEKNGIRYYLLAGTLLGALRHSDFIPWDDDVDIVFARDDYERFLEVFPKETEREDLKIVNYRDYPEFFDFISRLVDESVTIHNLKADRDYYNGRYSHPGADLFVFDNVSSHFRLQLFVLQIIYALAMGHRQYVDYDKYSGIQKVGAYILPAIGKMIPFKKLAAMYEYVSSIGRHNSGGWFISNDQQKKPYWGSIYPKKWFKRRVAGKIRGKDFPCPQGAKQELRMIYGDYMALPPEDKRYPEHFISMELVGKENS
ncbi:MAG: LicD family protein [Lachnospiraceae bacterium]|nr:LicD family protein [Lachnospiraceae bacterium]